MSDKSRPRSSSFAAVGTKQGVVTRSQTAAQRLKTEGVISDSTKSNIAVTRDTPAAGLSFTDIDVTLLLTLDYRLTTPLDDKTLVQTLQYHVAVLLTSKYRSNTPILLYNLC